MLEEAAVDLEQLAVAGVALHHAPVHLRRLLLGGVHEREAALQVLERDAVVQQCVPEVALRLQRELVRAHARAVCF